MPISKKVLLTLALALATLLLKPVLLQAFTLLELLIQVDLDSSQEYSLDYTALQLPNTGFTISNPGVDPVYLDGKTLLKSLEDNAAQAKQDGFALLDTTLLLELSATDISGGRADILTTYRMDVAQLRMQRAFLEGLLLDQNVVADQARAQRRARAMDLADARVMRFLEDGNGGGTWVRAVRALRADSIGNIDFRFSPQTEPDGILGHYGNHTDGSGNAYVWAVMDRNSNYAVGFTVDRDDDGVANSDDNCVDVANMDQNNHDDDTLGDACDDNDDNDSWPDADDNCPLVMNDDQSDADNDGIGDACDTDADNDGVNDGFDQCMGTGEDAVVDAYGCSIEDTCPCDNEWKNHGAYVRCNARTSGSFVDNGLISELEKDMIMSLAGQSTCGSR